MWRLCSDFIRTGAANPASGGAPPPDLIGVCIKGPERRRGGSGTEQLRTCHVRVKGSSRNKTQSSRERLLWVVIVVRPVRFLRRLLLLRRCGGHTTNEARASRTHGRLTRCPRESSYLVDPASSHMLVSKIKPCMSKYKHLYRETADGSLKQLSVYLMVPLLLG